MTHTNETIAPGHAPESTQPNTPQGQHNGWPLLIQAREIAQAMLGRLTTNGTVTVSRETLNQMGEISAQTEKASNLRHENQQRIYAAKAVLAKYPRPIIDDTVNAARADFRERFDIEPDQLCEMWEMAARDALTRHSPHPGKH